MKKYKANEFETGEDVFHSTKSTLKMTVIGLNEERDEVTCRWINDQNEVIKSTFFAPELRKWADKVYIAPATIYPRRSNNSW